ncbi:cobalt-precorrin-6A reductase [Roseibium marinum]|uniref:Precorrin-6A/cobalt-precorrin-6A reductase n=1 Tax=Roseibium marinum TaxID=281252 RepID=A0A2S3V348_9HYPH|nr:cobalt-precorrin-6A reductase [Roseibium marinum]POF34320.1 precorrin-6A/cobalt-precorrin-6A reductase [Roseibium marinum]
MTAKPDHILLLSGTQEARLLAGELAKAFPKVRITASYAGVVSDLPDPGVPVRVGGFGGTEGLTAYLVVEAVSVVVDATHPFAAQMSRNAVAAAAATGIPLLRLERPAWAPVEGDNWVDAGSMEEAAAALPSGARAFLAIGRKDIDCFTRRTDIHAVARMIEPPEAVLPDHWELILSRPPQTAEEEIALFRDRRITHVVTKNSGGKRSSAKIKAARHLGLPVVMVRRPDLPEARTFGGIADLLKAIQQKTAI